MKYLSLILTIYLIFSCAQKGALKTPLDEIPKISIDSTFPSKRQVNVDINSPIYIKFSESMNKKSVEKATLFYPFMSRYKTFNWLNSKELEIKVDTTLKKNFVHFITIQTTATDIYNRSLENSISFVFSTGDTIYNNKISGRVFDKNYKNVSQISLFLFKYIPADTLMFNLDYIQKGYTSTGKDGKFSFENIKNGKYIILGIKDKNKNELQDPNELVAVASDTIIISDSTDTNYLNNVNMFSFEDSRELFIESIKANYDGLFEIKFNKNINLTKENILSYLNFSHFDSNNFQLKIINVMQLKDRKTYDIYFQSDIDTTVNLIASFKYDSLIFRDSLLSIVDTSNNIFEFRYYPNDDTSSLYLVDHYPKGIYTGATNLRFRFNRILSELDKKNMELFVTRKIDTNIVVDSLDFSAKIDKNDLIITPQIDSLQKLKSSKFKCIFLPNAIFDVKKITNKDSIIQNIKTLTGKKGGSLEILVNSKNREENLTIVLKSRSNNNYLSYKIENKNNSILIDNIPDDYYSVMAYYGNQNGQIKFNSIYSNKPFCSSILTGNDSLKIRNGWTTVDTLFGY